MSGSAQRITLPPWARPTTTRTVARPSWIARPSAPALSLVPPPPSSGPRDSHRPMMGHASVRPASIAPPRAASIAPPRLSLVPPPPDPRIETLEQTISDLAAEFTSHKRRVLEESEPELVRLALTIAERIVGREITANPELIADWTHEAIEALGARHAVVVAVSPDLANVVEGATVDASLPMGSCEVRDGARTIEVGTRARMQAMTDALEVSE